MWKVIIADDDQIIRIGLRDLINWDELGCELIYLAKNGRDLVKSVQNLRPDIVITDIHMPVMDGIEAVRTIRALFNSIAMIILTAYFDFECAKAAIQNDVVDYIMKTAFLKEIPKAVLRSVERLSHMSSKNHVRHNDSFLRSLVNGVLDESTLSPLDADFFSFYQNKLQTFYLILIRCPDLIAPLQASDNSNSLLKIIQSAFPQENSVVLQAQRTNFCVLLYERVFPKDEIAGWIDSLRLSIRQFLELKTVAAVSGVHHGVKEVYMAYLEADAHVMSHFSDADGHVCFLQEDVAYARRPGEPIANITDMLISLIGQKNFSDARELFAEMKTLYAKSDSATVKISATVILTFCREFCKSHGGDLDTQLGMDIPVGVLLVKCKSLSQLAELISKTISVSAGLYEQYITQTDDVIHHVEDYIDRHYMDKLYLNVIADAVHVNKSYLSRVYKEKTGENLFDAIGRRKIQEAKKLIANTSLKMQEIATTVGIDDNSYFSRFFKKYTGLSPSDYEKKHR